MSKVYYDSDDLSPVLAGRYVTKVDGDTLTLDDGTVLAFEGNVGCCCGSGDYWLTELFQRGTPNARIMSAEVKTTQLGDDDTAVRDAVAAMWGPDRPALMFGRWSVPAPAGERQRLIWHKASTPGMGDLTLPWGPNFEDIHLLGHGWDREATGLPRVGAVITTTQGRGGGCRRREQDRAPDTEAGGAHGEAHRAVPGRRRGGPVCGFGGHAPRCPEPGAALHRRRAGGALLRDHRGPVVGAGAGPVGR